MSNTSKNPEPVKLVVTNDHIKEAIATFRKYFSYHPELAKVSDAEIEKAVIERLAGIQAVPRDLTINLWARQGVALEGGLPAELDCPIAIGKVVFDVILLVLGFVNLRLPPSWGGAEAAAKGIGAVVARDLPLWRELADNLQKAPDTAAKAYAIFAIGSKAWTAGMFGSIISSIASSMSTFDWIISGVTAIAQIIALVASSGVALVAQMVMQVTLWLFILEALTDAVEVCSRQPPAPPPTPPDWPEERHAGKFGGNGGNPFIDPVPDDATLLAVRVRYGEYVNLIQCIWNTGVAPAVGPAHGSETGDEYYIELLPDEFIFYVTGKCERYINQIAFHTNKRDTIGPFGGDDGVDFHFEAPHATGIQYQVAGFYGRAGDWVDQIGFIFRKRR